MAQSLVDESDRDLRDYQGTAGTAGTESGGTMVPEAEGDKDSSQRSQSNGEAGEPNRVSTGKKDEQASKKPSKLMELWGKIGLDVGTALMMFK